ncbi:MAG: serine protease [Patescibacteria group bacterium]
MTKIKTISIIAAILLLGALGALFFNVFALPFLLTNSYFERFQFVKDFKQGKIIINPKEQVYIQENTALEKAINNAQKVVVGTQKNGVVTGSGLIATSDGSIITLASLVSSGTKVNFNGEDINYKIIKKDLKNNLALIKVEKNDLYTVGFADFDNLIIGQRVFLIGVISVNTGNRFANEGIIRSFEENLIKTNISEKAIVNGSPLFNISGELVGLSFISQDGKVSAISIDTIKSFLGL